MATDHSSTKQLPLLVEIPIRGGVALVDFEDADLADFKWYANKNGRTIYAMRGKRSVYMHRVIMSRVLGRELQKGECVDHVDGNGVNNTRSNLRLATYSQNQHNQRKSVANTSGYKGVHWNKARQKWQVRIQSDGKRISLGYFDTPAEGHRAYCQAAKQFYGDFARDS